MMENDKMAVDEQTFSEEYLVKKFNKCEISKTLTFVDRKIIPRIKEYFDKKCIDYSKMTNDEILLYFILF